ncbi:MAG TPA: ABC transporter substrate-binding protein, partial [Thermopetrobacter sp.]|nr:ABC transporter substrate-binding protein [Thermopetrobacter sp.]
MMLSRRQLLRILSLLPALPSWRVIGGVARAGEETWRHGLSLFGALKYPPDFAHFDYVKSDAPKGGRVRLHAIGSFDSLNPHSFKGAAASGLGLVHDTLLKPALDEPASEYGLIAEAVTHPA